VTTSDPDFCKKPRRERVVMASLLPCARGALDGADDAHVRSAAA
jgi:hypothetical protein